ncbi:hypothetical protein H4C80_03310 [Pseudomonas juntendi]|uniref:Uncharacterized protein n=1 Tax=Pseudomonas juntendi TaxID=2666183 RepID=A0A7W2Q7J3_9PSED|nr:hypothetical protein [Pseudomonas juntendi]MBA6096177.1 hypothetical protein [Pseudomonas juntendi]
MFTTERFFARIWAFWFLMLMISVLTLGVAPKVVFVPMAVVSLLTFCWCVKCAYRSERFADFASLRLCFSLSAMPLFAFILSMAITYKQAKMEVMTALAISMIPLVLTAVAFALAYGRRTKVSSFMLHGDRVEVSEPGQANSWIVGGLGAGLSSLLYPMIKTYNNSMAVVLCVMLFISLYLVFYHRNNIASLRALIERERREARQYLLSEVEYVRALRDASWLARLFKLKRQ